MLQYYFLIFFLSLFISLLFTLIMIKTASWLNIVDIPDKKRKIHKANTPLLGGVAIFAAFFILMYLFRFRILAGNLEASHWQGVFIGACFLVIGGWLDDKYDLKPKHQVIFPVLAVVAVIAGGVSIAKISNPFGGFIYLQSLSAILIFFWLMGMMYHQAIGRLGRLGRGYYRHRRRYYFFIHHDHQILPAGHWFGGAGVIRRLPGLFNF